MTMYKITFERGHHAYIESETLENATHRRCPLGLLQWLDHELASRWESIDKVSKV